MFPTHDHRQKPPHPILLEVRQIAPNQIVMTYDQRTDIESATNVSNYWIRSNIEHPLPPGMATEGMDNALGNLNALRSDMARITLIGPSNMRFLLTSRFRAITGFVHVVLPCFVNLEGMTGYDGVNWAPFSRNIFIGM